MKDQINILVLVSILILVGIIFLIVKSFASKPISFPKITFPSKRTIAKEWLILIAAILLGLAFAYIEKLHLEGAVVKAKADGTLPSFIQENSPLNGQLVLLVTILIYSVRSIFWAVRTLKMKKE